MMASKKRVRPYPLSELPRILRLQILLARALRQHLLPVLSAAAAASDEGWALLEQAAGERLTLQVQEPYLFPADGAATRVQGGIAVVLERLGPAPLPAVLVLCEALVERLARTGLLSVLRAALSGAPVRVVDFCLREEAAGALGLAGPGLGLGMDLLVRTGATEGWARLLTRADLRLSAAPSMDVEALGGRLWGHRERLAQAELVLSIEAGLGQLPAGEVAALSPGDIVLLDHFGPRPVVGGPVWLRVGEGAFPAHLDGEGVTLLRPFEQRRMMMRSDEKQDGQAPGDEASREGSTRLLRELPVQVICEIGRVTMSGREVLELAPGAVVPVGRPLAGPVDLTVGGRTIARGELVDVEGEIGVRITEMLD